MHAYTAKFGGGVDGTVLNPIVLVVLLLAAVLLFALPRKLAVAPFILGAFLIPQGQQVYVAGVHVFILRLLILTAFICGIKTEDGKKPRLGGGWTSIDTAFVFYVVIVAVATMIQYPNISALINQIGYLWDYLLGYFALRCLIRTEYETLLAIRCLAVLTVILAITMTIEQLKMVNVFGLLGGVSSIPVLRDGRIRSQGVFQHSLTAGAFASSTIPLFLLLWRNRSARWLGSIGVIAASIMVFTTRTSTAYMAEAAGVFVVFLWPLRRKMKTIRIGVIIVIVGLAMVMKAPVWFVIAHIDLTGSSSSYQRAELIDQCVNHFSSWWLIGTKDAASWGWDMWDAQNMFVSAAESGGLGALIFFILLISRIFSRIGRARKRSSSKQQEWFLWLLGAAVFANVVNFYGANYFDQVYLAWFALISMVCARTVPPFRRSPLQQVELKVALPALTKAGLLSARR